MHPNSPRPGVTNAPTFPEMLRDALIEFGVIDPPPATLRTLIAEERLVEKLAAQLDALDPKLALGESSLTDLDLDSSPSKAMARKFAKLDPSRPGRRRRAR
jgi:hypothetical protein